MISIFKIFVAVAIVGVAALRINGAAIDFNGIDHPLNIENYDGNCVCTREFLPICGSDDTTYSNACMFDCEKRKNQDLRLKHMGACDEEFNILPISNGCICALQYDPVCGSDGETYFNECRFNCARTKDSSLALKSHGECKDEFEDMMCPCTNEYFPVCGSDGETYSNKCIFECKQQKKIDLRIIHYGECEEQLERVDKCICSREYFPVCGTDNRTYENECELDCQRRETPELDKKFEGPCEKVSDTIPLTNDDDDCFCIAVYDPICGSDGETYTNICTFNCEKNKQSNLKLLHRGECQKKSKLVETESICLCTRLYAPVCGSNDQTYSNECVLNCDRENDNSLTLKSYGPCDEPKITISPFEIEKSDNSSGDDIVSILPIEENDIGILPIDENNDVVGILPIKSECSCTHLYKPVCGTNGRTYENLCALKCDAQTSEGKRDNLQLKYHGECHNVAL